MKCAYYEVVSTKTEKAERLKALQQRQEQDPRIFRVYVDVVPNYGFPFSYRTGLQELMDGARKKQFDTFVFLSYENLKLDEQFAMNLLLRIREMDIRIALEMPTHTLHDTNITHDLKGRQIRYLLDLLDDPRTADANCFVDDRFDPAFVYLAGDYPCQIPSACEQPFREVILSDPESDLTLYRRDRDDWFYVPGYLKEELEQLYRTLHRDTF